MSRMGRKALQDWLFKGSQEEYKSDIDIQEIASTNSKSQDDYERYGFNEVTGKSYTSEELAATLKQIEEGNRLPKGYVYDKNHEIVAIKTLPQQLSDDEKVEELLDVILEKFKDYRTNGYVENCLIERLINRLLDNRQSRRNEIDAEENVLADDMNDLVGKLQALSKQEQV